jgi:hypothetical protein
MRLAQFGRQHQSVLLTGVRSTGSLRAIGRVEEANLPIEKNSAARMLFMKPPTQPGHPPPTMLPKGDYLDGPLTSFWASRPTVILRMGVSITQEGSDVEA